MGIITVTYKMLIDSIIFVYYEIILIRQIEKAANLPV